MSIKYRSTIFPYAYSGILLFLVSCTAPKVAFEVIQTSTAAPTSIHFKNTSVKMDAYRWDFGDGTVSDSISPTHRYTSSGNYLVTLNALKGSQAAIFQEYVAVRADENCRVRLITEFGEMTITLFDDTPLHRDNFLKLVTKKYYDGLLFHRVIPGFMIQGGDPHSRNAPLSKQIGAGESGKKITAEILPQHVHIRGALAAARDDNAEKKSSGSQFYIVQGSACDAEKLDKIEAERGFRYTAEQREMYLKYGGTPQLDMEYTVFGRVVDGLSVIDEITAIETKNDRPQRNIKMEIEAVD